MGPHATQIRSELACYDMGGHLATNKMCESVMSGEGVGHKRKKKPPKLEYYIDKSALGSYEWGNKDFKSTIILTASFWITVYWQRFYSPFTCL